MSSRRSRRQETSKTALGGLDSFLPSSIWILCTASFPPRACPSPAVVAPARALAVASPALASCCSGALKSPISVEFPNLCSGVALSKSPLPPYRCLWISPKFPWSRYSPHAVAAGGRLPRTAVERLLAAEGFLPRTAGSRCPLSTPATRHRTTMSTWEGCSSSLFGWDFWRRRMGWRHGAVLA